MKYRIERVKYPDGSKSLWWRIFSVFIISIYIQTLVQSDATIKSNNKIYGQIRIHQELPA